MATITSAATGAWSAGATWVGGNVPQPGDTVVAANGHIVTIDQNVDVHTITNSGTGRYVVGGSWTIVATDFIQAGIGGGLGLFLINTAISPTFQAVTARFSVSSGNSYIIYKSTGNGTHTITVNIQSGTGGSGANNHVVYHNSGSGVTWDISGTFMAGSGFGAHALNFITATTINLSADLYSSSTGYGISVGHISTVVTRLSGNDFGTSSYRAMFLSNTSYKIADSGLHETTVPSQTGTRKLSTNIGGASGFNGVRSGFSGVGT